MAGRVSSTLAVLILCSGVISCNAAHSRGPHGGGTTFNVLNFDAKPESLEEESTEAFIKAWRAACDFNGKAVLLIPPGVYQLSETIFQGPCKGPAPITVVLQGKLQAVSDLSLYPDKGWITFDNINGLELTGGGTVDGQGQNMWEYNDCKQNPSCTHLPASIYMTKVQNAKMKSIKLVNSMGFHMHITRCEQILLRGLKITAPESAPNTDGMHISRSRNVKVTRTTIQTGDDCVSFGQGMSNVTVSKVHCGPGHGISVGSLGKYPNEEDVQGVLVTNCTLVRTTNGVRIKTYAASDPSRASGIVFSDINMVDVKNPIIIDQTYGSKSTKPSLVKISDITYRNIGGTTTSPVFVNLECSSGAPCENVRFQNVKLKLDGLGIPSSICTNAKVAHIGPLIPPPC